MTWQAAHYVDKNQLQTQLTERFFFGRAECISNASVLDIGCGDGKISARIASCGAKSVVGWDLSSSMIEHARATHRLPALRFEQKDASLLKSYLETEERFDLIVSFHALHWMEGQLEILMGIRHLLQPKGKAYLLVASDGFDPLLVVADALLQKPRWKRAFAGFVNPLKRFSVEQYKELLKEAGFINCEVVESVQGDPLSSKQELEDQILSWLPHLKALQKGRREEFLQEMVEEFMQRYFPDQKHPSYLLDCNLEIVGQKPDLR